VRRADLEALAAGRGVATTWVTRFGGPFVSVLGTYGERTGTVALPREDFDADRFTPGAVAKVQQLVEGVTGGAR
jgi:hypothetical protein